MSRVEKRDISTCAECVREKVSERENKVRERMSEYYEYMYAGWIDVNECWRTRRPATTIEWYRDDDRRWYECIDNDDTDTHRCIIIIADDDDNDDVDDDDVDNCR